MDFFHSPRLLLESGVMSRAVLLARNMPCFQTKYLAMKEVLGISSQRFKKPKRKFNTIIKTNVFPGIFLG